MTPYDARTRTQQTKNTSTTYVYMYQGTVHLNIEISIHRIELSPRTHSSRRTAAVDGRRVLEQKVSTYTYVYFFT